MQIDRNELVDFQEIHLDSIGNIYEYKGELIRIINKNAEKSTKKLLECGLIDELIKMKYLIDTRICDLQYEGRLVLCHRCINVKQHYSQWSLEMMKEAALLVLKINAICNKYGYELKDCHQANIMYEGTRPIWIDFGSIAKVRSAEKWIAYDEFIKCYFYPIVLWRRGYDGIVRALYRSSYFINQEELASLMFYMPIKSIGKLKSVFDKTNEKKSYQYIEKMIRKEGKLKNSRWGDYHDAAWNKKNERFSYEINWINSMDDIHSMIEIGANQGIFSWMVSTDTNVERIIATDYDQNAVDKMYKKLQVLKTENVTPLLLDFVQMSHSELESKKCDLLVANAITHHLILTQGMTLEALVNRFAALTSKYVITEFMPRGVNKNRVPEWYTIEWFLSGLGRRFKVVNTQKINGRIIIIGEKEIHR